MQYRVSRTTQRKVLQERIKLLEAQLEQSEG